MISLKIKCVSNEIKVTMYKNCKVRTTCMYIKE